MNLLFYDLVQNVLAIAAENLQNAECAPLRTAFVDKEIKRNVLRSENFRCHNDIWREILMAFPAYQLGYQKLWTSK